MCDNLLQFRGDVCALAEVVVAGSKASNLRIFLLALQLQARHPLLQGRPLCMGSVEADSHTGQLLLLVSLDGRIGMNFKDILHEDI